MCNTGRQIMRIDLFIQSNHLNCCLLIECLTVVFTHTNDCMGRFSFLLNNFGYYFSLLVELILKLSMQ